LARSQYSRPARIVAFNTAEGWSRDVTVDIADELRRRFTEYIVAWQLAGAACPQANSSAPAAVNVAQ
jgi:hypothetical protein